MTNVTPGNFTLTNEQRQFKDMLDRYPRLLTYWDFEKREVKLQSIEQDISVMSRTEQIMLRFFVGVWCHNNKLDLDFTDLAGYLDKDNLQVIIDWLQKPVWP